MALLLRADVSYSAGQDSCRSSPYHVPINSEPINCHEKFSFSATTQTETYLLKADVPLTVLGTLFQVNLGPSRVSRNSTAPQNFIDFCGLLICRMETCELTTWKQSYVLDVCPSSIRISLASVTRPLHITPRIHYFSLRFPLAHLQDL